MNDDRPGSSKDNNIHVDFIAGDTLSLPGRLGMTYAPGKKEPLAPGYARDLETDLGWLKTEYGAEVLVSLMEDFEYEELEIPDLFQKAPELGIEVVRFPVVDGGVPPQDELEEYAAMIRSLVDRLKEGSTVVVHCHAGLGRTGLVVASILVALGNRPGEAIGFVRESRPGTLETSAQVDLVHQLEPELQGQH